MLKKRKYNPEEIDAKKKKFSIIERFPNKIKTLLYLGRYDRFKAILLLYYPCTWSLTLGANTIDIFYIKYMGLFFIGSILMRAAGCIINDMWDKDLDKKVIRTQNRPLANNSITYKEAFLFLIPHLGISLAILLQLPLKSIALGLGIMPVVISYPYMKRITYFPQFFLGLSFNSGVLVGYPVLSGVLDLEICLPLYAAGICWTLIYDTIYAHMDKHDDKVINVKSTALYFGENTKLICYMLCLTMFFLIYKVFSNKKNNTSNKKEYLPIIVLLFSVLYQSNIVRQTNLNDPLSCLKSFQKSRNFGLLILLSCLIHKISTNKEKI